LDAPLFPPSMEWAPFISLGLRSVCGRSASSTLNLFPNLCPSFSSSPRAAHGPFSLSLSHYRDGFSAAKRARLIFPLFFSFSSFSPTDDAEGWDCSSFAASGENLGLLPLLPLFPSERKTDEGGPFFPRSYDGGGHEISGISFLMNLEPLVFPLSIELIWR